MTAKCQLCGVTVEGRYVAADETEESMLMEYDNLSAHMWLHISDHHPEQVIEGILCQQRAAKLYAMNWADHTQTMIAVKVEWRTRMLARMTVTTRRESDTPAAYDDAATTGSNEKNDVRKASS